MTSASVGFCSSWRSSFKVKLSSGATFRSTSKSTSTFTSHAPLELAGVEIVGDERREVRTDVDEERGLVAWRPEVQGLRARDQLTREAVDGVLRLSGPVHGRGDDL